MPIAMPKLEGLCSQREARWFYAWYASVYEQLQPFFTSDSMREAGLDLAGVRGNVLDVLDVGAGTGTLSMQMLMRGIEPRKLTLLDQSDSMLKRARAKHALSLSTFVLADATHSLPLPSESRDRVVSSGVLYYFPDPVGALREQMRICRPGGIVLAMGSLQPKPRFIPHTPLPHTPIPPTPPTPQPHTQYPPIPYPGTPVPHTPPRPPLTPLVPPAYHPPYHPRLPPPLPPP